MILSGCQLRGFHQHTLDMFVALFGKRCTRHFVSGALFIAAEPAVTNGLSDRGETRDLPDFQCPGQRCDRARSRNGPKPFDSIRQQSRPLLQTSSPASIERPKPNSMARVSFKTVSRCGFTPKDSPHRTVPKLCLTTQPDHIQQHLSASLKNERCSNYA